jgi:hypothetical protein
MASNLFARYIWLVDTIRRHQKITFKQINELWKESGLSYGEEDDLALRTFHYHLAAIQDMFDINIECDKKDDYKYYIANAERLENDSLRTWFIDSYATLNQVRADEKLEGRIIFEDIPSGHQWLTLITQAMRKGKVIRMTQQGFCKPHESSFEVEPYYLKVIKRRWYILARNPYYSDCNKEKNKADGGSRPNDVYLLYALDRVHDVKLTDKKFKMKKDFNIDKYFEGCYGIITDKNIPIERIVLKAKHPHCDYIESLPLHKSQKVINRNEEATTFELHIRPTFDFYQILLSQADTAEVLEPQKVREEMMRFTENMLSLYKHD